MGVTQPLERVTLTESERDRRHDLPEGYNAPVPLSTKLDRLLVKLDQVNREITDTV
ncbi:hypothetical protein [Streptomyces toxytricini]|uniref:hypothetical protein n=1 Tax=Streptomyces toxytricini TaxID=67369 RepID=UPI00343FA1FB